MRGYAKVEVVRALQARENYIKFMGDVEEKFLEYVQRYYDQEFPKLGRFDKWLRRNQTPGQFLSSMLGWNSYSEQLYKVLNREELNNVCIFSNRHNTNPTSAAIRKLCYASSDGLIMVDQDIAGFIEKWEYTK